MRLRSRRVFISYARDEWHRRDDLAEWLRNHDFVADYDDAPDESRRTVLVQRIAGRLENADCLIVLGTRLSLASTWVRDEVEYAATLPRPPYYLPVLAERVDPLPDWFVRKEPLLGAVRYVECFEDFSALEAPMEEVRRGFRITLGAAVALALALFLAVPLLLWWLLRPIVDAADGGTREAQSWVEQVNRDIERHPFGRLRRVIVGQNEDGVSEIEYRDEASGDLLARDALDDENLVRRRFFRKGREVAVDLVVTLRAPNGAISQVKLRRIHPHGDAGPVIEDLFDSDGKLVSKRMRMAANEPWTYFAERSRTLFAMHPFVPLYR